MPPIQPMPSLFLSYSRKDDACLQELLAVLRPALRDFELMPFVDQDIVAGQHWRQEIEQALAQAGAAVLLISNHFLGSKFILREELPVLLPRERSGRLRLFTLYVTSVPRSSLRVPLPQLGGSEPTYDLHAIQAMNGPDRPLDQMAPAERTALFAKLAEQVRATPPDARPARQRLSGAHGHGGAARPECWIRLSRVGDELVHEMLFPGHSHWISPSLDAKDALDSLAIWQPGLPFDGELLFELLFGRDPDAYLELLSDPWSDQPGVREAPSRWPWRIRLSIASADGDLQSLPWTSIAHAGRRLADDGWTIELAAPLAPRARPELPNHALIMPGPTLLIFPEADSDPSAAAHQRDLRGLLDGLWSAQRRPSLVFTASDRAGIAARLADAPRLVYVYARVERDGTWRLHLPGEPGLGLAEFRSLFSSVPPSALFLNLLGEDAVEALPETACLSEQPGCRFLALQATPRGQARIAQAAGLAWIEALLGAEQRLDPVAALHANGHAFAACRTAYQEWETRVGNTVLDEDLAELLLDRDRQRAALNQARDDFLASRGGLRVQCFVALGTPGNRLAAFPQQAFTHLQLHQRAGVRVQLQPVALLPTDTDPERVDHRFRRQLGLKPSLQPAEGLRPRAHLSGELLMPLVVWTLNDPAGPEQRRDVARAVLRWSRERLLPGCADDIRVLSLIALEPSDDQELDALREALRELDDALTDQAGFNRAPSFQFEDLEPLGGVDKKHLRAYFLSEHCSCPDNLRLVYPDLLLAGRREMPFDQALTLIREARDTGWHAWKQARAPD